MGVADELRINSPDLPGAALLTSQSVWGILHGMETFTQLLSLDETGTAVSVSVGILMNQVRRQSITTFYHAMGLFNLCIPLYNLRSAGHMYVAVKVIKSFENF
jgi:hypothetical protein